MTEPRGSFLFSNLPFQAFLHVCVCVYVYEYINNWREEKEGENDEIML